MGTDSMPQHGVTGNNTGGKSRWHRNINSMNLLLIFSKP
ncbi:hypothetical protein [Morganella morganii IS15]|nr:hypothetical protein [Morganella morganii IS15]